VWCSNLQAKATFSKLANVNRQATFMDFNKSWCYRWSILYTGTVGYNNSSNRTTYHPQEGRGYDHMTPLKFCRLPWCSASHRFRGSSATAELFVQDVYVKLLGNGVVSVCLWAYFNRPPIFRRTFVCRFNCYAELCNA